MILFCHGFYSTCITYANGSCAGVLFLCWLSVFLHNILNTAEARITRLDIEVFHNVVEIHLFWDPKVKGQGDEVQTSVRAWVFAVF